MGEAETGQRYGRANNEFWAYSCDYNLANTATDVQY